MSSPRYQPLRSFLATRRDESVLLRFADVEQIIQWRLPPSARRYRAWWANAETHPQAVAWLAAGWQVAFVDLADELVHFGRRA
jgi:hypothetical protein